MSVTIPTPEQLKKIAGDVGLSLTDRDVASFIALMQPNIEAYNVVDRLPDRLPTVKYPRTPGCRPKPIERSCRRNDRARDRLSGPTDLQPLRA